MIIEKSSTFSMREILHQNMAFHLRKDPSSIIPNSLVRIHKALNHVMLGIPFLKVKNSDFSHFLILMIMQFQIAIP